MIELNSPPGAAFPAALHVVLPTEAEPAPTDFPTAFPAAFPAGSEPATGTGPAADAGCGLVAGRKLREPFRHPITKLIMLPDDTTLTEDIIEAIRLMGEERHAFECLGEVAPEGATFSGDILRYGPGAVGKLDREVAALRRGRDMLAVFLPLLFIFALAFRATLLLGLGISAVVALGLLYTLTLRGATRLGTLVEAVRQARSRRTRGELKLRTIMQELGIFEENSESQASGPIST